MDWRTIVAVATAMAACGGDDAGGGGSDAGTSTADATTGGSSSTDASSDGGDTSTGGIEPDPTPILERTPAIALDCSELRPMTSEGATGGLSRSEGVVALDGALFELYSGDALQLRTRDIDGGIGETFVLEPMIFEVQASQTTALRGDLVSWWMRPATVSDAELWFARTDAALMSVVEPKPISGPAAPYLTPNAIVPAGDDGFAIFYDAQGHTGGGSLRMLMVDAAGDPTGDEIVLAELGNNFAASLAGAAATAEGFTVAYTVAAMPHHQEVFVVGLDGNGGERYAPVQLSASASATRRAFTASRGRGVLAVGDDVWVAFSDDATDVDASVGKREILIAVVDASGGATTHRLATLADDEEESVPMLLPMGDRVGLLWTRGTIIWVCGGCISDHDAKFVVLDPDALVPVSEVVTLPNTGNGILVPSVAALGDDLLVTGSFDFHATSQAASGAIRCTAG